MNKRAVMEIQKLKYFYAVANLLHVTRAAEETHVSQPSLTQSIHSLESELGVPLLKKQGRGVALTEYGVFLKKRLDVLLPQFDGIPDEIARLRSSVNNTVRLNILAASNFVMNAIIKYKKNNPDVIFDFEQNEMKRDCDIVITTNGSTPSKRENYLKRFVKEERIFLAVPKKSAYAENSGVNLADLKDENFIMLTNYRLFGVICKNFCSVAGFAPKILFESDSPSVVQSVIGMGAGVSFWPERSWGKIKNKNIALLPVSSPECKRDIIIELHERATISKYAEDFYEFILKQI